MATLSVAFQQCRINTLTPDLRTSPLSHPSTAFTCIRMYIRECPHRTARCQRARPPDSQTRRGRLSAFPVTPSTSGILIGDVIRVTAIGETKTLPRYFRDLEAAMFVVS